jgi:chemotaxis protein MotB
MTAGCSLVPQSRLEDCHMRCQTLQAEVSRLKDEALGLRGENRDLSQRALDDARHIRTLEQANERLERSVTAYQSERDKLVEAYDQFNRQVQAADSVSDVSAPR